ncbi:MAG: glutamine synthetase family protein [Saccharofermentans sp.]|nr:glutamine synthetase family protein [Saccharofermentans sp.]
MELTYSEFAQYIEEEDIKFIRLTFSDVYGNTKNIAVMPNMIEQIFNNGMAINASLIPGFEEDPEHSLIIHPDFTTAKFLPWRPEHGKVVRVLCGITNEDGSTFELDTRDVLKRAIADAKKEGIEFKFGNRMEFYLFKLDEDGNPTSTPYDNASYMDVAPLDKGENVRREICLTLERMGVIPFNSHHEDGPGQNEIDFVSSDPLTAADNVNTFRNVVRTVAARNGLHADFSPKPLTGKPGNGFHINVAVYKDGKCQLNPAIAGILKHAYESTIFYNPQDESYKRLNTFKNQLKASWNIDSKNKAVIVPTTTRDDNYLQLRTPDSLANPYLAYALMIYSIIDGIKNNLSPDDFSNEVALPANLREASEAAKSSEFINSIFTKRLIEAYTK